MEQIPIQNHTLYRNTILLLSERVKEYSCMLNLLLSLPQEAPKDILYILQELTGWENQNRHWPAVRARQQLETIISKK